MFYTILIFPLNFEKKWVSLKYGKKDWMNSFWYLGTFGQELNHITFDNQTSRQLRLKTTPQNNLLLLLMSYPSACTKCFATSTNSFVHAEEWGIINQKLPEVYIHHLLKDKQLEKFQFKVKNSCTFCCQLTQIFLSIFDIHGEYIAKKKLNVCRVNR